MNDILKAILENAARSAVQPQGGGRGAAMPRQQAGADPMQSIIEGILGGGGQAQQQRPRQQQGGGGIADILGGILGGAQRSGTNQAGGIADLIGILGGGGGGLGGNMGTNAIANILAQRLGIPPAIAKIAVAFFVAKFLGKMAKGRQQQQQQAPRRTDDPRNYEYVPQDNADDLDLDSILDDMDDDFALNSHFSDNGMASELAQMTGMDIKKANLALAEMAKLVGQERRTIKPVRVEKNDGLKSLLDEW